MLWWTFLQVFSKWLFHSLFPRFQWCARPLWGTVRHLNTGRHMPNVASRYVICGGLVVTMSCSQAWDRRFGSPLDTFWYLVGQQYLSLKLNDSAKIWKIFKGKPLYCVYGVSSTKRSLGTIHEEKGFSSRFRISILSWYGLRCWKWSRKTSPSALWFVGLLVYSYSPWFRRTSIISLSASSLAFCWASQLYKWPVLFCNACLEGIW